MTRILSKNFEYDIEDCGKRAHGGNSPVTYGDYFELDTGERLALETALTNQEDLYSAQCLDYIFHLKKKSSLNSSVQSVCRVESENTPMFKINGSEKKDQEF